MTGECVDCGGDVGAKDNAGWYRERCEECQRRIAEEARPRVECIREQMTERQREIVDRHSAGEWT